MKRGIYAGFFKRFFDLLLSFLAIIILSPILILVYLLSLIILGGNPIFKQYRPGKNGKIFPLYKFRSMTNKKDKNGDFLPDAERITGWGKLLRKTSIDELPQLINILKGDMSIIGPRPRMVEECVFLEDSQLDRFAVKPGITGWAQVNGRNTITLDEVVELDKYYIEHLSFWFDIKIIFKTVGYIFGRGKKDINKEGTVSNEFHGDYLLRIGKVTKEEYDEKISLAKEMINNSKSKNKSSNKNILIADSTAKTETSNDKTVDLDADSSNETDSNADDDLVTNEEIETDLNSTKNLDQATEIKPEIEEAKESQSSHKEGED